MDPKTRASGETLGEAPVVDCGAHVEHIFTVLRQPERVQILLPRWLRAQRWFAGKAREIRGASLVVAVPLSEHSVFCVMRVHYASGGPEDYAVPVCWLPQDSDSPTLSPATVLARTTNPEGYLCDATADARVHDDLFRAITGAERFDAERASVVGLPSPGARAPQPEPSQLMTQEQTNTSIRFGDRYVLKLFRKLETGTHPDVEIARFLGREPRFPHVAALHGTLELHVARPGSRSGDGQATTLAMLTQWVANAEDAWGHVVDLAEAHMRRVVTGTAGRAVAGTKTNAPAADPSARLLADRLGERSAQLHLRLASGEGDADFAPEPTRRADLQTWLSDLGRQAHRTRAVLEDERPRIPERWRSPVERLLEQPAGLLARFDPLHTRDVDVVRIRCHGDFHLGQVLFLRDARDKPDFVFLDFEGEPARPLRERRAKSWALRDVAGMLRSLEYAAWMAHRRVSGADADVRDATLEQAASAWAREMGAAFLDTYRKAVGEAPVNLVPAEASDFVLMLDAFLLEKAMYELRYELSHRPDWVDIPLRGVATALGDSLP